MILSLLVTSAAVLVAQRGAAPVAPPPASMGAGADWTTYLGDAGRTHYSTLTEITKANVATLQVAWSYDTGDRGEFQANNLIVAGVLYTASPTRKAIALDAATGKELWKFDATTERPGAGGGRQRGVVYWADAQGGEARIFTGVGNYLYALDARTGAPIRSFAENGALHLGSGTERDGSERINVTLNTPGQIYKDLYITTGIANQPGSLRAYDVRSGAMRWIFHLVPRPGEFGAETWPPGGIGTSGGASNWTGSALDEARGIIYVPTESATPDFWGGDRKGENLFANSLVALDANTGKRLWHHQIYRHDLFDRDLPTPPVLLTVTHNGRRIDAVAQGTKHGLLFVFNRVTGEPLWPLREQAVRPTDVPGEYNWPSQPVPTKPAPLMRQAYTEADASTISPEANKVTRERAAVWASSGPFPTPSLKPTIMFPGYDGGMEWGGAAADPQGVYYVNVNEIPWTYQLIPARKPDGRPLSPGERGYLTQCASCHGLERQGEPASGFPPLVEIASKPREYSNLIVDKGGPGRMPAFGQDLPDAQRRAILDYLYGVEPPDPATGAGGRAGGGRGGQNAVPYAFTGFQRLLDRERYPAIKPPWGTLNAVDLNTGEIRWKVPLGEYPELTKRGIPPTGTENYGGPVVTATGLIFIAATADEKIRAFDKETGKILWEATLPFGGNATPSVYMAGGRQYVVISAGGGKSGRPSGGIIVAFALPR